MFTINMGLIAISGDPMPNKADKMGRAEVLTKKGISPDKSVFSLTTEEALENISGVVEKRGLCVNILSLSILPLKQCNPPFNRFQSNWII
jgi:hypothetical protein